MAEDPAFTEKYTFYAWDQPGYFGSKPSRRKMTDINFQKDVEIAQSLLQVN